ncbi:hypothetical protein SCUCBS95973_009748 [Sporothrix curviconia]|uniref:MARVEL domain-containing protein n=1 Tax=Sporothrix curviconia TaxID=1260050 RepID=A0ABP0CY37_9PEZI
MCDNKRHLRTKVISLVGNPISHVAVRTLRLIFAIVVLGAIGRSLHLFRGPRAARIRFPDAWGFMLFTAVWTFLGAIFVLVAGLCYPVHRVVSYGRVAFITSAVYVATESCPLEDDVCGSINLAVGFGAIEALLFAVTAPLTTALVFFPPGNANINKINNNNLDHNNTRQALILSWKILRSPCRLAIGEYQQEETARQKLDV